ncbi:MAG TPA: V-type ATPase subunit [Thermoanaerobaculia bacterium]|nr:V-type ATPase subunit [Thermoanaerobaculia bacterium]
MPLHHAYGFVRASAKRGDMLSREAIDALRYAPDEPSAKRAAEAYGISSEGRRLATLVVRYGTIIRCYRDAAPLVRAILRTHEIENVKLGWRAVVRKLREEQWLPLWRDLQDLGTIGPDVFQSTTSLRQVVDKLIGTPYGSIAHDVHLAHFEDLGAAELAFDRWASMAIVREADSLDREPLARKIAEAFVRQRDDEIAARAEIYQLPADVADAARALPRTRSKVDLQQLCRRAFAGQPLKIAPAIAFIALTERDYRLGRALVERRADADVDPAVDRVLEGSSAHR